MDIKGILSYIKKNNKKILIISGIIIFLVVISIISIYFIKKRNSSAQQNSSISIGSTGDVTEPSYETSYDPIMNQEQTLPMPSMPIQEEDNQTSILNNTSMPFQEEVNQTPILPTTLTPSQLEAPESSILTLPSIPVQQETTPIPTSGDMSSQPLVQPVSQPSAQPINPNSGTFISDTMKPLIDGPAILPPDSISQPAQEIETTNPIMNNSQITQTPIPAACDIGFYRRNGDTNCSPCVLNNSEGLVWTSIGTPSGKCEYKCSDGYAKHPSGEGCKKIITNKTNTVKSWNNYQLECKNSIPLDPKVGGGNALIRLLYFGKVSSNIPIFISNLSGDLIKIDDFSDGSDKCLLGVLKPRKYVAVQIPESKTKEYVIAIGGPAAGDKISALKAFQTMLGGLNFADGSVKMLGSPSEEVLSWLPPNARNMKLLYFKAPQNIAHVFIKIDKA